jgi:hypothetical protein
MDAAIISRASSQPLACFLTGVKGCNLLFPQDNGIYILSRVTKNLPIHALQPKRPYKK